MISILIPLHNGFEFLSDAVDSVLNQTYKKWELIIGINGFEKNSEVEIKTRELVYNKNYLDIYNIKVIYYDSNTKTDTLNLMVKDCSYDFIAILDADDIWLPEKLEKQIPYLNTYDVVGTNCRYFGDKTHSPLLPFGDLKDFNFFDYNPVINSSAIIRKELAKWHNNWNNNQKEVGVEDYNLWLELFIQKKKFFNLDEILCLHRCHDNSSFNHQNHLYVNELKSYWLNFN